MIKKAVYSSNSFDKPNAEMKKHMPSIFMILFGLFIYFSFPNETNVADSYRGFGPMLYAVVMVLYLVFGRIGTLILFIFISILIHIIPKIFRKKE
jgi:purine-cytosine permease-like protein